MDERCFELASKHVGDGYIRQATEAMAGLNSKMRLLLEQAGGIFGLMQKRKHKVTCLPPVLSRESMLTLVQAT